MPDEFIITDIEFQGNSLTVERMRDGLCLKRHPDDVRKFDFQDDAIAEPDIEQPRSERDVLKDYMDQFAQVVHDYEDGDAPSPQLDLAQGRRPSRPRRNNPRYYNEEFINNIR